MSAIERDWFPTHLRVTVIGARNLRAKRKKGPNNCYTVIRLGPEKYRTSVQGGTLNPEWKEECTLELPLVLDNSDRWTLHLTVKHNNTRLPVDNFLGHVSVPIAELYQNKNRRKNEWYDLQSKPNKVAKDRGQLQLAFQFLRDNMTASAYELSRARPQSVFNKFKDKVASLKYGMSHEILPNEGPSTSLKYHRNGRMSKSHSYVAQMDSRQEINATFNSAEANNQIEPEVHPYLFHSFHKNSGDDVHTKVKLRKENSSFVEDKSETSAVNLEETTAVKLETKDTDHNKTLEPAVVAPELPKIETNPGNILTSYNHPVEFLRPSRFDDKLILTSFMLAGEGQDSAVERLKIKPTTCCAQCFRNAELRSR
ncbi:rab11 family-interacting protein 2-like [Mobula hypostoma]|uniref:rab11 family-interacting protein 2-like n=1 Tax=Mobula hypostoma TaxID=723540 RepID=UPI002FC28522